MIMVSLHFRFYVHYDWIQVTYDYWLWDTKAHAVIMDGTLLLFKRFVCALPFCILLSPQSILQDFLSPLHLLHRHQDCPLLLVPHLTVVVLYVADVAV